MDDDLLAAFQPAVQSRPVEAATGGGERVGTLMKRDEACILRVAERERLVGARLAGAGPRREGAARIVKDEYAGRGDVAPALGGGME